VTNILFDIPHEGDSRLEVYDLRGRRVRVLADRAFQAGRHNLQWAGDNQDRVSCPSGIYMIHFTFDGRSCLRKVVYVR
jgi:flagellar hook assembly protein FlgD